jgi:response regulator NasT
VETKGPKRVLVVDDEVLVRWQIVEVLKRMGIESIVECGDSACTRQILETEQFDLIFMDIDLGEATSGVDLALEIRSAHEVGIIYVSAHGNWGAHPNVRKTACAFVPKPFVESDIKRGVRECLIKSKSHAK